jgi:hypothetical protein
MQSQAQGVAHLMAQVMDCEYAAGVLVDPPWAVLARQVDGGHRGMPIIGNKHAVLAVQRPSQRQLQGRFKGSQAQERKPVLRMSEKGESRHLSAKETPRTSKLTMKDISSGAPPE